MNFYIKTFGCAANVSDSERLESYYLNRGFEKAKSIVDADLVVINTCMVRGSAEERVYGLIRNLKNDKKKYPKTPKIILTGCLVGLISKDRTEKLLEHIKQRVSEVDEFLPIEEVGFEYLAIRNNKDNALVPISNGCNNYCTYCVVPYARGGEKSRPFEEIIKECRDLTIKGFKEITLIGQNVNSYGSDLVKKDNYPLNRKSIKPVMVNHLGKNRIPTLFPYLLEEIAKIKSLEKINFISSNPWDFSSELIEVIKNNPKISREIHLPVQSGDDEILKKMNRWYTTRQYLDLVNNIKVKVDGVTFTTDIIVGFPGETEKQFQNTVNLCNKIRFTKAYVSQYSDRPMTLAHKNLNDDVPKKEKKKRWGILDNLINRK